MQTIAILLSLLTVLAFITVVHYYLKRVIHSRQPEPRHFEPDLYLVERPDLIARIPENEELIPDANAILTHSELRPKLERKAG